MPPDAQDAGTPDAYLDPLEETSLVAERPKLRADCVDGPRPCPWVGCRHHLFLDVRETGSIKFNFPDVAVEDMTRPTCSLDLADEGGLSLEAVGSAMNLTRERARQIEVRTLRRLNVLREHA